MPDIANIQETLGIDSEVSTTQYNQEFDYMWKTEDVAVALNFSTTPIRRMLEDLNALGFVERFKHYAGNADGWQLKSE